MLFWVLLTATAVIGSAWMAWPFLRTRTFEVVGAEGTISVYRDQISEIERDLSAGVISESECDAARSEIERRALYSARTLDQGLLVSMRSNSAASAVILTAVVFSIGLYGLVGSPETPDQPLAERRTELLTKQADAGDIESRIQLLIQRTRENPESFEDWWMLARSYAAMGDHASSADAYRQAVELAGDRPAVLSAYGEAMTLANGNKVPVAARLIFEQLARDSEDPRARYYVALAKAQAQDFQAALNDWTALALSSSPDAPWMPLVRRDILNMARFLKQDVANYLPDASPAEIASAGGSGLLPSESSDRIADLEAALEVEPMDYKSWLELAEAYVQRGDTESASGALAKVRGKYAAAPFVLSKIAETERTLGLDLIVERPRGPSKAEIDAASKMTQSEQDAMIRGMVAGLAARLEEQPKDPDGWAMLVRSYATLGQTQKARDAFKTASSVFEKDPATLQAIRAQIAGIVDID